MPQIYIYTLKYMCKSAGLKQLITTEISGINRNKFRHRDIKCQNKTTDKNNRITIFREDVKSQLQMFTIASNS